MDRSRTKFPEGIIIDREARGVSLDKIYVENILDEWNTGDIPHRREIGRSDANISLPIRPCFSRESTLRDFQSGTWSYTCLGRTRRFPRGAGWSRTSRSFFTNRR